MTIQQIKQLLDKYFNGNTSLLEEETLRQYFQQANVPAELKPYQPLFQYLKSAREDSLSDGFEEKILQSIRQDTTSVKIRSLQFYGLRIAAAVALLIGIYFLIPKQESLQAPDTATATMVKWEKYEPESTEEAFEKTQAALKILAKKLNGSADKAAKDIQRMEPIKKVFK